MAAPKVSGIGWEIRDTEDLLHRLQTNRIEVTDVHENRHVHVSVNLGDNVNINRPDFG